MNKNLTENEVDDLVIAQADDKDAWDRSVTVNRRKGFYLNFPRPVDIVSDKDILSGTPVFRGTRVPVSALLENLEEGVSIDEFVQNFPTVKREQAIKILKLFRYSLSQFKVA
ncbi:MAG: DUF433 domain-containing protein [Pyrinomonadaceae bacterium]